MTATSRSPLSSLGLPFSMTEVPTRVCCQAAAVHGVWWLCWSARPIADCVWEYRPTEQACALVSVVFTASRRRAAATSQHCM
jgi:hypothetical protein